MKETKSNRLSATVLKAMSVFGGVQVVGILCSIIRTKLVAVWLGATGMGIFALYNSTIEMISVFTRFELRNSAVRELASAGSRLGLICSVVRRWAWALGILGAILTIVLSPWLSEWTFGDKDHTLGYIILSVAVMLYSVTDGENAILQGTSMLKPLAKASVVGAVASIVLSIPLLYFLRIDGIVPVILTYFVVTAIAVYFYRRRPEKPRVKVSPQDVLKEGKGFMLLGVYMAISMFMGIVVSYLFMIYLNRSADTSMVGYYQAGYSLVNKYVGLIFTAIAMEYYPRLAQVIKSRKRTSTFVSHEVMLSVWIIIPVIALFIAADDLIVNIFYSEEFSVIIPFISCAVIGTIFRAVSFCIAYVILARGDGKVYLITETTSAVIGLTLNIVFFEAFGMLGLGISYILWYMLYALIVYVVYRYNYGLRMGQGISRLMIYAVAMGIASVTLSVYVGWWATAIVAVVALYFSARRLLRRR